MPIGLIVGALVFRLSAFVLRHPFLARTARHCTLLAGVWLFPTVLFGFMDWQHFYDGAWLFPVKIKLILTAVLIVLIFTSLFLAYQKGDESGLVLANYSLSFVVVVILGYFGGNLVYGGQPPTVAETYHVGMQVFNDNCGGCHPRGGNAIDPGLPLANSAMTRSFKDFHDFIRRPTRPGGVSGTMPPFPEEKISDQDARELYQYIIHVLENR